MTHVHVYHALIRGFPGYSKIIMTLNFDHTFQYTVTKVLLSLR